MTIEPGTRFGPHEILSPLGKGGMGEVYRARDTRLGRDVAIKVLPEEFFDEKDRVARFEREARSLAALNHPGIAAIHSFEEVSGRHLLVMELVDGEGLDARIASGPLPLEEALSIAGQLAEALEAAHEKGIVHRDLKPANVMLRHDGRAKILDFGLAKALEGDAAPGSTPQATQSPTMTARATAAGVILGTAAYMSPEQARGRPVDKRTDVWAFGCVLYEMLTGRRAFEGETVSDVLAAILRGDVDLSLLPPGTPPRVLSVLRRTLQKDPRQRLHDIADARIELGEEKEAPVTSAASSASATATTATTATTAVSAAAPSSRSGRAALLPWGVAALAIAGAAGWTLLGPRGGPPDRVLKLAVLPPPAASSSGPIDLSADGRQVVFLAAGADGRNRLYVRSLDALDARLLPGTEGADSPFFSPDGRSVAFFAGKKLKRVDLAGGPPRELADAPEQRGGSWGSQNVIVFAPEGGGVIYRVSASGGDASAVTTLNKATQEVSHRWPRFLPDGKRFLFMSRKPKPPGRLSIEVTSIEGGARTRLVESSTGGVYSRGRLYFVRETTLLSQALDLKTLAISGEPASVAEGVWRNPNTDGLTAFSVAEDGAVAWRRGGLATSQLTWLDRQGQSLGTVGAPGIVGSIALSPDGRRILVEITDPVRDTGALFVVDAATGMTTRATFGTGNQTRGLFSSDGRSIVFSGDSLGAFDLYRQEIGTTGDPSPLLASGVWKFAESLSPDGRYLSYTRSEPGKPRDIWILPMTGEARPFQFSQASGEEWSSEFSPDGRFLAYVSDESGRSEVFVRTFPSSPAKWQLSVEGGTTPTWRRDGKELFFLSPEGGVVAVPISVSARGLEPGPARTLFRSGALRVPSVLGSGTTFVPSADGQRFLAAVLVNQAEASPIVIQSGAPR